MININKLYISITYEIFNKVSIAYGDYVKLDIEVGAICGKHSGQKSKPL